MHLDALSARHDMSFSAHTSLQMVSQALTQLNHEKSRPVLPRVRLEVTVFDLEKIIEQVKIMVFE